LNKNGRMSPINIRQQKYKANRLLGMYPVNAARAAGYSENYAKQACRVEKLVKVSLEDEFERAGLTDKAIIAHALSGLQALKLQSCNIYISKPSAESIDGDKLIINKNSNDFVEIEDWNARHKYFETILKLIDKLKDKEPAASVNLNNIINNIGQPKRINAESIKRETNIRVH
jgi:hypothetical protein